jgi:hypothetical protein
MSGYHSHAVAFIKKFPLGDKLTHEKFDDWAIRRDLLKEPRSRSSDSDAWLAHLQRRHQVRYQINSAGLSPRMRDDGHPTFVIQRTSSHIYEVMAAHKAIITHDTARKVQSLARTKRKQVLKLMQGVNFDQLEPYMKAFVESLADEAMQFRDRIELEAELLHTKYVRLARRLEDLVAAGRLQPDPTIQLSLLLSPPEQTEEEDDNDGDEG